MCGPSAIAELLICCCTQLEKHFGNPRDIEFAVGEDNTVYLLQVNIVVCTFDNVYVNYHLLYIFCFEKKSGEKSGELSFGCNCFLIFKSIY